MNIKDILALTPEQQIRAVESGDISDAIVYTIPLDTALTNFPVEISGNFFACIFGGTAAGIYDGTANATVQFNKLEPNNGNGINFTQGLQVVRPFARFYVTATAQAGNVIKFLIATSFPLFGVTDNRSMGAQATLLSQIATNTLNTVTQDTSIKNNNRSLNGDTGTQVNAQATATGSTETLYTVTAAKTFYLTDLMVDVLAENTNVSGYVVVTNASDTIQYYLYQTAPTSGAVTAVNSRAAGISYSYPRKIPAGYKIKAYSSATTLRVQAAIHGWEE